MVPEEYSEFFVATATVAGALIGLLLVAISVRPDAATRTAHITTRLRAVAALSAFLETLFLSLPALRPHRNAAGRPGPPVTPLDSLRAIGVHLRPGGRNRCHSATTAGTGDTSARPDTPAPA